MIRADVGLRGSVGFGAEPIMRTKEKKIMVRGGRERER